MKKFFNDVFSIFSILCLLFCISLPISNIKKPIPDIPAATDDFSKEQQYAITRCRNYIQTFNISKNRLKRQLVFDKITPEMGNWAIEYVENTDKVDWKQEAVQSAYHYMEDADWTPIQLHNQLTGEIEGYTEDEARYAVTCIFGQENSYN